jgi:RNA-directed DNA polymerase
MERNPLAQAGAERVQAVNTNLPSLATWHVQLLRRLQRLLLHATSAKYLATRRITQDNQGKKTAGVDGVASLTPEQRLELASRLNLIGKGKSVRRV